MKKLKNIELLTESFARLPGVGHKSAEKMAYSVLEMSDEDAKIFAESIQNVKKSIHKCPICGAYTEAEICDICSDKNRDFSKLIVVSYPKDILVFEKLNTYNGGYHVLGGVLSAINGVGIDDLNIGSLLKRIDDNKVTELIIATNPTTEGETTALYIAKLLENKNINITRLAYGLPIGGHLEYADSLTLERALEGRKKI